MSDNKTNTGNKSTGNGSTGDWSTGDGSTGNGSTGDWSTGNWSTGDWSTGNWSTGHFSTIDYDGFGAFNKKCTPKEWDEAAIPDFLYFCLCEFIGSSDMTDEEKENNTKHETTGGFLRVYDYKESFQKSYNQASDEEKQQLLMLPNFNAEVFLEISGIDVTKKDNSKEISELKKQAENILSRIKELEK